MNKAQGIISKILKRIFKPRVRMLPSEWVEKHIRLDPKTSNISGRYSLLHTPYLRQIYDDVANPRVRKIVLKKSAQIGATQLANNLLLYFVCNFTFPALMIMPSRESAQQFCERSLIPSIYNSDEVKKFLTGNPDDIKKTEMLFTSCIVRCIGAGSPSKLASNPACLVIIDEADKMEDFSSQGEAPALELAEDRTIKYPNDKKILILSTPTTENSSVVHSQYLKGSQSKYFVSCPHCQFEQTLTFSRDTIYFPPECKLEDGYDLDRVEREARYVCANPDCKAHLTESDKLGMVRGGHWKDTNPKPFPAEIRSYHISAMYSFDVSWGAMAKLFLLCGSDRGKLRNFYNSYLGECFQERATTITSEAIEKVIAESPKYNRGELIEKPLAILMAVDTQDSSFWFATQAVFKDGSSCVLDWGQALGFEDLEIIFKRKYKVRGTEQEFGIFKSLIDSGGHRTSDIKRFCIKNYGKFIPCYGRTSKNGLLENTRVLTVPFEGYELTTVALNDDYFKNQLYLSAIKQRLRKFYLPQDSDETLKKQLSSEHLVAKKNSQGREEPVWTCSNGNNHLGDVLKYLEGLKSILAEKLRQAAAKEDAPEAPEEINAVEPRHYQLRTGGSYNGGNVSWD